MKSYSALSVRPIVSSGLILALSIAVVFPETWPWMLALALGVMTLGAGVALNALGIATGGTGNLQSRRFFPGLSAAIDRSVESDSTATPTESSPETDCTVWDVF